MRFFLPGKTHLFDFKKEFIQYFTAIDENREAWMFIRNAFQGEVDEILMKPKKSFLS